MLRFGRLEKSRFGRGSEKEVKELRLYDSVHTCFSKASGMGWIGWDGMGWDGIGSNVFGTWGWGLGDE